MINKFMLAALAATALVPAAAQAQRVPAASVAVVDVDRISRECTACRAAATQLQSQQTTLRNRITTLQNQLATTGRPIEQAVNALNGRQPDAALQKRITDFQAQQRAAETELANGQRTLQSTQINVNQQIGARLNTIVQSIATARGANVAVSRDSVLYAATNIDITNEVLAQLNQQLPAVSVTPLPQQQQQQRPQGR